MEKYNLEDMISNPPIQPRYLPEDKLTIHGQIEIIYTQENKENLEVSILSKKKVYSWQENQSPILWDVSKYL